MRASVWATRSLCAPSKRARRYAIDSLEACRGKHPEARLVRNTRLRPGLQGSGECLMHGLFGDIQIPKKAHERRQNPTPTPLGIESR